MLDLLLQMRQARIHMALVVDEYGGIDGLVTIEDLVETITGDIADEHDEPGPPQMVERPDGTLDARRAHAGRGLRGAARPGADRARSAAADIDTVGGLVFTLAGRVPARGELVSHSSGLEFRVLDADPRRIRRLRVRRPGAGAQRRRRIGQAREEAGRRARIAIGDLGRGLHRAGALLGQGVRRMPRFKGKPPGSGSGEMSRRTRRCGRPSR